MNENEKRIQWAACPPGGGTGYTVRASKRTTTTHTREVHG